MNDRPGAFNVLRGEALEVSPSPYGSVGRLAAVEADTRCRAYRWPRDSHEATVFVAMYPYTAAGGAPGRPAHGPS